ncbi:MAG: tetratricopeptide repeat protein [Bacteroidales bacterium]|nr:tetratricopeptide repeat protein [Bacteroidales bacterium]MBQ2912648.1 tetratricopeptide repeat protein [Bacteroidales bacterium]MBQ7017564.1 tetratricopeptide repeat protein [Bacteroidales bacterium]MBR2477302.1 tetratricopeptide repeat protein [Bacteroidales bacterium]
MEKKKAISQILTTLEIEALLRESKVEEAYSQLNALLEAEPRNAYGWYLLGGIYRRQQLWGEAINAYNQAKMIDPDGPAAVAIESIYEILNFRNTDMLNP